MQVRIRHPSGQNTISLAETATTQDLAQRIRDISGIESFDLKYGYPPRFWQFDAQDGATVLSHVSVNLDGEQLIVSRKPRESTDKKSNEGEQQDTAHATKDQKHLEHHSSASFSFSGFEKDPPSKKISGSMRPMSLSRNDTPEVPLP